MFGRWNTKRQTASRWLVVWMAALLVAFSLGGCPLLDNTSGSGTDVTNNDGTGKPADGTDGTNGQDGAVGEQGPQGEQGATGPQGDVGPAGADGTDGTDGLNGISCWDLNGNGIGDLEEDFNGDGDFNALDCQNLPGPQGLPCWDLNANGVGDLEEDFNGDGNYDALDCRGLQGPQGETGTAGRDGVDGINGIDGQDGADGLDGRDCWDFNGNGIGDAEEDTNGDGVVDVLDCKYGAAFAGDGLVQEGDFLSINFDLLDDLYAKIGGNESVLPLQIGTVTNAALELIVNGVRALHISEGLGIALGEHADASQPGSFVWADSTDEPYAAQAPDEFRVRANGGFYFKHNDPRDLHLRALQPPAHDVYGRLPEQRRQLGQFVGPQREAQHRYGGHAGRPDQAR